MTEVTSQNRRATRVPPLHGRGNDPSVVRSSVAGRCAGASGNLLGQTADTCRTLGTRMIFLGKYIILMSHFSFGDSEESTSLWYVDYGVRVKWLEWAGLKRKRYICMIIFSGRIFFV